VDSGYILVQGLKPFLFPRGRVGIGALNAPKMPLWSELEKPTALIQTPLGSGSLPLFKISFPISA